MTGLTPVGTPASVLVKRGRVGGLYASAMSGQDATEPDVAQQDTERIFDRLVDEGQQRLGRSWSGVISTGLLGGLDVGVGVLALLLVEHATESKVLGGLAFSIPRPEGPLVLDGFSRFVTTRGGAYLFLPSVSGIRYLAGSAGR